MAHFLFHRGGNRPQNVNRPVQGDRTELGQDPAWLCARAKQRERLPKGGFPSSPERFLTAQACSVLSLPLAFLCTRLICLVKFLQYVLSHGFPGVSRTCSIRGTPEYSPEITLGLCPGQC